MNIEDMTYEEFEQWLKERLKGLTITDVIEVDPDDPLVELIQRLIVVLQRRMQNLG
jgi:hypothetical protein